MTRQLRALIHCLHFSFAAGTVRLMVDVYAFVLHSPHSPPSQLLLARLGLPSRTRLRTVCARPD